MNCYKVDDIFCVLYIYVTSIQIRTGLYPDNTNNLCGLDLE